jgi:glyoxylase-like metal-dependent hydrolase (beta-lactamase superfamily II)
MFTFSTYFANCYVVGCAETKEALTIDPTFTTETDAKKVLGVIDQLGFNLKYIINTHGHPDHTAGNEILKTATNAPILIHENDAPMLIRIAKNVRARALFGLHATTPPADATFQDGDIISIGHIQFKVLHTPGHTKGSVSLLGDNIVFTGDTLFAGSIGRTDFPGGSFEEIIHSIKTKLLILPDDMKVYSGHGPASTIGKEKKHNPFLHV